MKNIKIYKKWWFWLLLIVLLVLVFPKTCGPVKPLANSTTTYSCSGIPLVFGSNAKDIWCSGFCIIKDNTIIGKQTEKSIDDSSIPFMSGMTEQFSKLLLPLIGILILIGIIQWLGSYKKKGTTEIKVYRGN